MAQAAQMTNDYADAPGSTIQRGSREGSVIVYRFSQISVRTDWLSDRRARNLQPMDVRYHNSTANMHRGGGHAAIANLPDAERSHYLSTTEDWRSLMRRSEKIVKPILDNENVSLVEFEVPCKYLFRPRPTNPLSRGEGEWLYCDYPEFIGNFAKAIYYKPKNLTDTIVIDKDKHISQIPRNRKPLPGLGGQ